MIKMTQEENKKETPVDQRIPAGQAMERLLASNEFPVFMAQVEELRAEAHLNYMLNGNSEHCGKWWKARLHAFDEVMGITNRIIMKMKIAIEDEKNEEFQRSY